MKEGRVGGDLAMFIEEEKREHFAAAALNVFADFVFIEDKRWSFSTPSFKG